MFCENDIEKIKHILNTDKFNMSLIDVAGKQYDISFHNILTAVLKIKEIVDENSKKTDINNPYQE